MLTVVAEISQRLHYQLVVTADQRVEIYAGVSRDGADDLLVGKVAADGGDAGFAAAGGDNLG